MPQIVKNFLQWGELGLIPWLGRSPGEGNSYPNQYSGLENSMDCIVHGVAKSRTQLSDFHSERYPTVCGWWQAGHSSSLYSQRSGEEMRLPFTGVGSLVTRETSRGAWPFDKNNHQQAPWASTEEGQSCI